MQYCFVYFGGSSPFNHFMLMHVTGSCLLSFVWIFLMRYLASLMVWFSILSVVLGFAGLSAYSGYRLYKVLVTSNSNGDLSILQVDLIIISGF